MKYNKIATVICSAALSLLTLTGCEGGDLFSINAPDWLSSKADSIAAEKAKNQGDDVIEGMEEDVYTVGATDYSTGWWAQFSKYYQIPEGGKWMTLKEISARLKETYRSAYTEDEGCYIKIGNFLNRPEYKFESERKTSGMVYWVKER